MMKVKTALDPRLLACDNSTKMNWLRVNMNIFDITKIIMSVYYSQAVTPAEPRKSDPTARV